MTTQLDEFRVQIAQGVSQANVVKLMKLRGMSIIDAIKASRELFHLSLGSAKQVVAGNSAYRLEAVSSEPLQKELIQAIENGEEC